MKSPAELTELFRKEGLKITPQRVSVFKALHENDEHPTAESVHGAVCEEMPSVSLRTVYQTLNDLASMGELVQLDVGTGSARFDPNIEPHHHLVCERCGNVSDVYADFGSIQLPWSKRRGFHVTRTEIVFRGVCDECMGREKSRETSREKPRGTANQTGRGTGRSTGPSTGPGTGPGTGRRTGPTRDLTRTPKRTPKRTPRRKGAING